MKLTIVLERDKDGCFASCPGIQGCYSQGTNYREALVNIIEAILLHLEEVGS